MRYFLFFFFLAGTVAFSALGALVSPGFYWWLLIFAPFTLIGILDQVQRGHSVLRNYPVIGHLRWMFEDVRPELRQYFFSGDKEETPFNRDQRSIVYQRAKSVEDNLPFGSKLRFYESGYSWLNHSIAPVEMNTEACRVEIGNAACEKPYSASLLNISAMSFGALSSNAIMALNRGAKEGNFAHDTGEGGLSRYHRQGGDLIYEIGTGYFGCRTGDGKFDPEKFKTLARDGQVKMTELKLSQGAKPGHGGILPAAKLTREIAEARGVRMGEDVVSPKRHSAFSTPIEMVEFLQQMRELSGGKPVGFKLCVGHGWEFMAIVKAMLKTDIYPDFIVVDGAEGGTGAAPVEFADHMGTPMIEGLAFVRNTLTGADIRDKIRIGASGKIVSAFDMVNALALGADFCNSARGFMFALGCIQSLSCHTNRCPVGVTTQNPRRIRALVVEDKYKRVANLHANTIHAFTDVLTSAGLSSPDDLKSFHFFSRDGDGISATHDDRGDWMQPGELIEGCANTRYANLWVKASAESFRPGAGQ